ncbi:prenyltransferase [Salinicoccus sp. ID82-1]|uniref:Prenyltransferase n=1 Tax=Salinicoccus cyprini TaxID=2493691 RepID=A0A558AWU1_9STAP|nr:MULTISPECIES: prenyltransferase [Salinicoccus]MCG1010115.1 prenyltransferase [Salinicoccus sp. ID82-1]TVT28724.1 prenyltransferase [Salinicoccus cyprini]
MEKQESYSLKGFGMLLRVVAVVASSIATIISTILPLAFGYDISNVDLFLLFLLLVVGAFLVHGVLTHVFNDIADFKSGTDQESPGMLSGGSRVLQNGVMTLDMLVRIGLVVTLLLLIATALFITFGQMELAILTIVGLWGAISYSLKPFRFAYRPFLGEWLSLFPSILLLGLAAPWLMLDDIPLWAWQNALINALWCMAWVMIHHVPDIEADRNATPMKQTTVVWAARQFGVKAAPSPALFYLVIVGLLAISVIWDRPIAAVGTLLLLGYGIYMVLKINVDDVEQVTAYEKVLLLLAMATAIWLGLFPEM